MAFSASASAASGAAIPPTFRMTLRNASLQFRPPASFSFLSNSARSAGDTRILSLFVARHPEDVDEAMGCATRPCHRLPRSCRTAFRDLCPVADHRSHTRLNNRSEPSHQHHRRGENHGSLHPPCQARRFLSVHDQAATVFRPKRHRLSAAPWRQSRSDAVSLWNNHAAEIAA